MNLNKHGVIQALGIAFYCILTGTFLWNANSIFGNIGNFFGPILMLLVLSVSVLICAILVFYTPYKLFIEGKKKEALSVVVTTALSLFGFLLVFLLGLLLFKN